MTNRLLCVLMAAVMLACQSATEREQELTNCGVIAVDRESAGQCLVAKYDWRAGDALASAERALELGDSVRWADMTHRDSVERRDAERRGVRWHRVRLREKPNAPALSLLSTDSVERPDGSFGHGELSLWCDDDGRQIVAFSAPVKIGDASRIRLYVDGTGRKNLVPPMGWRRITANMAVAREPAMMRLRLSVGSELFMAFPSGGGASMRTQFHIIGFSEYEREFEAHCPD